MSARQRALGLDSCFCSLFMTPSRELRAYSESEALFHCALRSLEGAPGSVPLLRVSIKTNERAPGRAQWQLSGLYSRIRGFTGSLQRRDSLPSNFA